MVDLTCGSLIELRHPQHSFSTESCDWLTTSWSNRVVGYYFDPAWSGFADVVIGS